MTTTSRERQEIRGTAVRGWIGAAALAVALCAPTVGASPAAVGIGPMADGRIRLAN